MLPTPPPRIICPHIDREVVLSGGLDDPLWQGAAGIELVQALNGEPGPFATRLFLLWSDTTLYAAFSCEDDYIWGNVAERDGAIYDEECVELFLNPAGSPHQYYEINVSPKNVVFDACILNERREERPEAPFTGLRDWDAEGLITAVSIQGSADIPGEGIGWIAEYAIPFTAFYGAPHTPPRPGDIWRANFYRIDSPRPGELELYAWSPTFRGSFHLPWRFGHLEFGA